MPHPRTQIAATYGTALAQGLIIVSFPASGAVLKASHHLSDAQYGAIFLPQTLLAIVGSLLAAGLAQRIGLPKLGRLAGMASTLAALLLFATAQLSDDIAYVALLAAIGLAGLGFGLSSAPLNSAPGLLFPRRRETALVIVHTLVGAGFAIGPLLASFAVERGYWAGFPLAIAILSMMLLLPSFPAAEAPFAPQSGDETPPRAAPAFWALAAIAILYALCEGTFASWVVIFLEEERGVAPRYAGLALSAFWAALVGGRLLISVLVLRLSSRRIWSALPLLMIAAFLALPRTTGATSGILLFGSAGLACSAFFPLTVGFASERFPRQVAWVSSMLTAALMVGVGVGSFLLGAFKRLSDLATLYAWSSGYAALLLALVFVTQRSMRKEK